MIVAVPVRYRQDPNSNPNPALGYSGPSPIVASFVSTKHRNVTEGQTDTAMAITALAMPTRCKNIPFLPLKCDENYD